MKFGSFNYPLNQPANLWLCLSGFTMTCFLNNLSDSGLTTVFTLINVQHRRILSSRNTETEFSLRFWMQRSLIPNCNLALAFSFVPFQVLSHNLCTVLSIPHDPVALEEHFRDDDDGPVSSQGYMPYLNKYILDKVTTTTAFCFTQVEA